MHIKFHGLIFHVLIGKKICGVLIFMVIVAWKVQSLSDLLSMPASYCGLIFMDKGHTMKCTKIYTPEKFLHVWY